MRNNFYTHLKNLHYLAPRFWENEIKSANYVKNILYSLKIPFIVQNYEVSYPHWEEYFLKVDNEFLEVLPCWFKGWYFINNFKLEDSSSLEPVYDNFVIAYNNKSNNISTPIIYPNLWLAINKNDVNKVKNAKIVEWYLKVSKYNFTGENILVWNLKEPKKILICHYDSFWGWSLDNWTWTALLLSLVKEIDLTNYLILFAWSEEISLDEYEKYWCYWYRQFEKEYSFLIESAKEIIIFDSFWYKKNEIITDINILKEAFLIENTNILPKVKMYASKFEYILENYHTPSDTPDKIDNINFSEILSLIKN